MLGDAAVWGGGAIPNSQSPGQFVATEGVERLHDPHWSKEGKGRITKKEKYKNNKMRSFNLNLLYFNCRGLGNEDRLYLL